MSMYLLQCVKALIISSILTYTGKFRPLIAQDNQYTVSVDTME